MNESVDARQDFFLYFGSLARARRVRVKARLQVCQPINDLWYVRIILDQFLNVAQSVLNWKRLATFHLFHRFFNFLDLTDKNGLLRFRKRNVDNLLEPGQPLVDFRLVIGYFGQVLNVIQNFLD